LIPTANLAALALSAARRFADRDALIWRDRAWSWAELDDRVRRAANGLVARGLRPGERVLVHARNSNAMFESMCLPRRELRREPAHHRRCFSRSRRGGARCESGDAD
jgi:acyl-CoA synthetase (AMP-forming)/AMP-acid ligase II